MIRSTLYVMLAASTLGMTSRFASALESRIAEMPRRGSAWIALIGVRLAVDGEALEHPAQNQGERVAHFGAEQRIRELPNLECES